MACRPGETVKPDKGRIQQQELFPWLPVDPSSPQTVSHPGVYVPAAVGKRMPSSGCRDGTCMRLEVALPG